MPWLLSLLRILHVSFPHIFFYFQTLGPHNSKLRGHSSVVVLLFLKTLLNSTVVFESVLIAIFSHKRKQDISSLLYGWVIVQKLVLIQYQVNTWAVLPILIPIPYFSLGEQLIYFFVGETNVPLFMKWIHHQYENSNGKKIACRLNLRTLIFRWQLTQKVIFSHIHCSGLRYSMLPKWVHPSPFCIFFIISFHRQHWRNDTLL